MAYKRISPQPVIEGGTGASTLTSHGVLLGNTTSAITATSAGTTGQVLTGVTGSAPTFQSPAASSITITGDSGGGLTGSSFTFTGGTTGLTFAGATSTETLGGTLVVANGGTGAATLTSHGVLLGNGTSAVTATAAGTTGQVLTGVTGSAPTFQSPAASSISITGDSGGALTGASFTFTGGTTGLTFAGSGSTETLGGTLVVANGGTGRASSTAYAVICGGTTSTAAQQSIAGVGTSGQVLTSNGAGALPTFQTASGGVTTINGDSGSVTGSTVSVVTGNSTLNSGQTVLFSGSGTTLTLNVTNASSSTCLGNTAGKAGMTGDNVTCFGASAGSGLTSGRLNTFIGAGTAGTLTTGSRNTLIGYNAGANYAGAEGSNILIGATVNGTASESNVLRIGAGTGSGNGNLNKAFIAGIQTITVTGTAVLVSSSDQLGIAVSSQRFKSDIQDMKDDSSALYKLRPVSFVWDKDSAPGLKDATDLRQYGLIAEEAAPIVPHAVNLDKEGQPLNINYQDLIGMLINEVQKLNKRIEILEGK